MTSIAARRRRSTWLAISIAAISFAIVVVLAVAGWRTLANSTAGSEVQSTDRVSTRRLPWTATALVGSLDEDGELTSLVVMVLEPDGTGGDIVSIAATADRSNGLVDTLAPLNAILEVDGPTELLRSVETLTGLRFDVVEMIDVDRFVEIASPLGEVPVTLASQVEDASSEETWPAGQNDLTVPEAARLLTATDPSIADWYFEPARDEVWRGVAARVGAGIGSAEPIASDGDVPVPVTLDEFTDRLFAGATGYQALPFTVVDDDRIAEQLPLEYANAFGAANVDAVVLHDNSQVIIVFGSIAPSRVGAPFSAPNIRLVSDFSEQDLEEVGITNGDMLKWAVDRFTFVHVNVVAIGGLDGAPVPEITQIEVTDPAVVEGVSESYPLLLGPVEVSVTDAPIEGIDITVTLGRSALVRYEQDLAALAAVTNETTDATTDETTDETTEETE